MKNKKIIIALIVTMGVVAILIGVGFIVVNKKSAGEVGEKQNEEIVKNNKSFSVEKFDEENEGVFLTNYVDTVNGFYFKYPVFINLEKYLKNQYIDATSVDHNPNKKKTIESWISSSLGKIYLTSLEESISKEKLPNFITTFKEKGEVKQIKQISTFSNNGIEWEKYNIVYENENTYLVYMFTQNDLTYILSFGALNGEKIKEKALEEMPDQLWNTIAENKEQIADHIVKSFTFTDDLEYMLNLTEASILSYNVGAGYDTEYINVYDDEKDEKVARLTIPRRISSIYEEAHVKTEKMNIENVVKNVTTNSYKHSAFSTDKYTYSIKHEGEVMSIKNSEGEEYKVRYYEIESVNKDSKYSNQEHVYAFETDEYVGVISSPLITNGYNSLNYMIKNLSFRDYSEGFWDVQKFVK